jgi:hypothetical protein
VTWEDLANRLPANHHVTVQALPLEVGASLHWQEGAQWVVLEIEEGDSEIRDGVVTFRRAVVLFNGPAREGRDFIVARGVPAPSSLTPLTIVPDWSSGVTGQFGTIVGGNVESVAAGQCGLAYAKAGHVRAGHSALAISDFADVEAGDWSLAVTHHGLSAVAGVGGLARCDEFGTARVGRVGIAIAECRGTAIAGDNGLAVGWMAGNAEAAEEGVALALEDMGGMAGAAKAGERGIAIGVGEEATVAAGEAGVLILVVKGRAHVAYVGEDGILPAVSYRLDEGGRFVPAEPASGA